MNCAYQLSDGPCGAPIAADSQSYSGFTHLHSSGWCHWASPAAYVGSETGTIFKLCVVCGKTGIENEEHILYSGHHFRTE